MGRYVARVTVSDLMAVGVEGEFDKDDLPVIIAVQACRQFLATLRGEGRYNIHFSVERQENGISRRYGISMTQDGEVLSVEEDE